jgi:hypothetical protein
MKMVKSLLLGSAAGLVAVAGAQAADLPVKAKPVEYVKVCSLYGAGFWYVPGTDTCLKIGSYVREEIGWDQAGSLVTGLATGGGQFDRTDTSQLAFRTRSSISVDLRTQTEYGVLRSYLEGGFDSSGVAGGAPANDTVWFDRGFIQFAGLTAGRIRSYFDINSPYEFAYMTQLTNGDSNTFRGLWGIAYTADFGNGVSASISFEDGGSSDQGNNAGQTRGRGRHDVNLSMASQFGLGTESFDNEGWKFPDVIGALRIDQAWGYAQVAAALHDASAGYYQTGGTALAAGIDVNGHPSDAYGWAITGGFHLNDVLGFKGDTFGVQAVYSVGASTYASSFAGGQQVYGSGNSAAFGWISDGVFTTGSGVELTSVWSINAGYQHFWNPKWRTSLYGGYTEIDYDSTATSMMCSTSAANPGGPATPLGTAFAGVTNCSPSFSFWQIGSRTQWNPHPDLDIGLDLVWSHINTAFAGTATLAANGARPGGVYNIQDQDVFTGLFRIQRNFLP